MSTAGIDYGMGRTNIDVKTGIRYGVISQHAVLQAWADSAEPDYGDATCPKCGGENVIVADDYQGDIPEHFKHGHGCSDFVCNSCEYIFDSSEAYGDEPRGWSYSGDGYELTDCLDSDIMVLSAPFYTLGNYCSPCVPGGVSLESPNADGAKAYCLGHDWFEDGKAPYPVFSVETGKKILPA